MENETPGAVTMAEWDGNVIGCYDADDHASTQGPPQESSCGMIKYKKTGQGVGQIFPKEDL